MVTPDECAGRSRGPFLALTIAMVLLCGGLVAGVTAASATGHAPTDTAVAGDHDETVDTVQEQPDGPRAAFEIAPQTPGPGEQVSFDGSPSTTPFGEILEYNWAFGDGTTAAGAVVGHTYEEPGEYSVTLSIVGQENLTDTTTRVLSVLGEPSASFAVQPQTPGSGEQVTFDAGGSTTPNGEIVEYTWAFGDGTTASGQTVTHRYGTAGAYEVSLTVVDEDGRTAAVTDSVTVRGEPSATFSVQPRTAESGESVAFDAGGSLSPTGEIVGYEWTFGDGTTATTAATAVTHTYDDPGEYAVTLTVVDEAGRTAQATDSLTVRGEPGAAFAVQPRTAESGETVTFDAGGSTSPNGDIVDYEWAFGDGRTETTGDTAVTHVYDDPGEYTVSLTVEDTTGKLDTVTRPVTVESVDDPETTVDSDAERDETGGSVEATVSNARAGRLVEVMAPRPLAEQEYRLERVGVVPATDLDFGLDIETSAEPLETTPEGEFEFEGTEQLGYLSVESDLENENIEETEFTYRLDTERLEELNSSPQDVALFRYDEATGEWVEHETEVIDQGNGVVLLRTRAEGLSEWTVAARTPELGITDTEIDVEVATTEEDVTIQVFVTNTGGADGSYEAQLLTNDEVVDRKDATVPANRTVIIDFLRSFDRPDEYEIQVNDVRVGQVTITEDEEAIVDTPSQNETDGTGEDGGGDGPADTDDADESGTVDGLGGMLVALSAMTLGGLYLWYRRDRLS